MKSSVGRMAALVCLVASARAENPPVIERIGGLTPRDAAFEIKLDILMLQKGSAAGFRLVEEEFKRDPRPHVKARYAEFLIEGKGWGAPEGQGEQGWKLALEACGEHSFHALGVLAWDKFAGRYERIAPAAGFVLLKIGTDAGSAKAWLTLGDVHLRGLGGQPVDLAEAERCFRRAALLGHPHPLTRLAKAHESAEPPNRAKAAELYYEASCRGSAAGETRLRELFEQKDPAGTRAYHLALLWETYMGFDHQTPRIRQSIDTLLQTRDDPEILLAVGRAHLRGLPGIRDPRKAYAFIDQAAQLGSDDARAERAGLLAEGAGVAKDPVRALTDLQDLAGKENATALAILGYYCYWGSLGKLLPKDAAKALAYSRRAADAGDWFGQVNTGVAFEFGVGTAVNYPFAAHYYRMAARRGSAVAREKVGRILPFVLK